MLVIIRASKRQRKCGYGIAFIYGNFIWKRTGTWGFTTKELMTNILGRIISMQEILKESELVDLLNLWS